MQAELQKLRKQLSEILVSDKALKQALREVNKMDIIKASLIVRNPKHQEVKVGEILEGSFRRMCLWEIIFSSRMPARL